MIAAGHREEEEPAWRDRDGQNVVRQDRKAGIFCTVLPAPFLAREIDWDAATKESNLHTAVNNVRFLIPPAGICGEAG